MGTASLPFRGHPSAVIFNAIREGAPTSPVRLNPDVPAELERIINRALEKDRELRYQHASEMRAELQRLKRDTDSSRSPAAAATETGAPPYAMPGTIPPSGSATAVATSASGAVAAGPSSSSVAAVEPPRRKAWAVVGGVVALVLASMAAGGYYFLHPAPSAIDSVA